MLQEHLEIQLPDGVADAVFWHPGDGQSYPGVLYLTDIAGIRPAQIQAAEKLASHGYAVLMPNLFYRTSRPPVLKSMAELYQRLPELAGPLTPEKVDADTSAYVDFLLDRTGVRAEAPIGAVGYCFSGAVAMRTAAGRPERVAACLSFHGGGLYTDKPTSPHLLLPAIKAHLYFGHATNDKSMPADAIQSLERALAEWGGVWESETYLAAHGWTASDSGAYDAVQAERAFNKVIEVFREELRHP